LKIRVDDVLVDGEKTAIRFTLTATHVGEGLGVPPSNKPVRVTGMSITRWEDGKIAEGWNEFDKAGLAAQIAPGPH
jgi:predicted ester cyclase